MSRFTGAAGYSETPLIIGTELGYPPYSFLDEEGNPTGYNIDLTNAIARIMQLNVEIRVGTWGEIRQALESGEIDAIAGMYYSLERDKKVDFSPPFSSVRHAIFVHNGSPSIEKEEDLRGKDIIVMQGNIMHDYVLENGLSDNPVTVSTQADALSLLAQGRYDCALIGRFQGAYWLHELELTGVEMTGPLLNFSHYCFAVGEGNVELQSIITEGLITLTSTGREKQIYDKWLGVLERPAISRATVIKYLAGAGIPLLLLLGFLINRSVRLRSQVAEHSRDLQERANELKCVFDVAESSIKAETIEEFLQDVVGLISSGWMYSEITRVRIVFDDRTYISTPFTETKWSQSCDILVEGGHHGRVEVFYLEERPELEEGPFLLAERQLITAICQLLSETIHAQLAEERFQAKKIKYHKLFQEMLNGFAVHEIICDAQGDPVDYRFEEVNPAFERLTGLKAERVTGKTVLEVMPDLEESWIQRYGQVALTGKPDFFENYSRELDKHFEVTAFSPAPNQFACIFVDVTEKKRYEESLKNHRLRLQSLASRLANAEELLRQDIAAGLHDSIGQDLAALKLSVDIMRQGDDSEKSTSDDETGGALDQISGALDGVLQKICTLSFQLCPPGLHGVGFLPTLEWLIAQFNSRHEIDFHLVVEDQPAEMDKQARGILFQMIRELMVNAVKHGRPGEIKVVLSMKTENLHAAVIDDGNGFDVPAATAATESSAGFGLFSIGERLAFLSGKLEIESAPGEGARVMIIFPLGNIDREKGGEQ
ncbi:MAG: transporter substrate-binding domain-containing protein [Gemmatimonadales bacterium]|nr:transporter substrate-binding domain-containing protein [Gemmatimonadales bacterium]